MAPTLLWIGLGNMGRGMCKNLVEKGDLSNPLLIYNRTAQRASDLSSELPAGKTQVVEDIRDGASRADIIFTCVANDDAIGELYETILSSGHVKNKVFIECSTVHPSTTESLARSVIEAGAEFVAAPVFGAPAAAEAGQLIAVLAGDTASVAKARPWFKGVTARAEIDLAGHPCGKASALKVLGNTFILNMVEHLAEAYTVAEKSGLGTEPLRQFVDSLFGGVYSAYSKRMLSGDYHTREEPLFAVDLARKDARHAMSLAGAAGVKMSNVENGDAQLAKVQKHQGATGDIASLYGAARQDAGLKYENGHQG